MAIRTLPNIAQSHRLVQFLATLDSYPTMYIFEFLEFVNFHIKTFNPKCVIVIEVPM